MLDLAIQLKGPVKTFRILPKHHFKSSSGVSKLEVQDRKRVGWDLSTLRMRAPLNGYGSRAKANHPRRRCTPTGQTIAVPCDCTCALPEGGTVLQRTPSSVKDGCIENRS